MASKKISKLLTPAQKNESEYEEDTRDFFDPGEIIDSIIDNDLRPKKKKILVDDRDLPRAANFIEWCVDKRFLRDDGHVPFPRQIQVATQLYNEACPDCSDPKLINNMFDETIEEIRERISFLEFGICPNCKKTRLDLYNEGKINLYNELCACWGQRSGKTVFAGSQLSTYQLHRFLCLEDPGKTFGLVPKTPLFMFFTAVTAKQAADTLWVWFQGAVEDSPWFKSLNATLDYYGKRLGEELYSHGKTYIKYGYKNIHCKFVAPNKKALRGKTNFLTGIDEWGWFDHDAESKKVTANGTEINIALIRGLITIRGAYKKLFLEGNYDLPNAISCNVSSPADINDNIMRRIRKAKEISTILGSHYPTWLVNTSLPYESLQEEFADDPIKAARDIGAQPPIASNPFIENVKFVEKISVCVPVCEYTRQDHTDEFGNRSVYIKMIDIIPEKSIPRILSIDTGKSNNSFAITMGHLENDVNDIQKQIFKLDLAVECQPRAVDGKKVPINFSKMFSECIVTLCDNYNIVLVVYDRWQSVHQIDELRKLGINSQCYSLTWEDFCTIKAKFYEEMILLLKPEVPLKSLWESSNMEALQLRYSAFHLLVQTITVREIGNTVTKPVNGTDDLFRCVWLAAAFVFDEDYKSMFEANGVFKSMTRNQEFLVKVASKSVGSAIFVDNEKFGSLISVKTQH